MFGGIGEIIIAFLLVFGGGAATGYYAKDDAPIQVLECPKVQKPTPIRGLVIEDCVDNCPVNMEVRLTRETRGDIDRFAQDCRSYEKTTDKLIDTYNTSVEEESKRLEAKRND